jgi:MFS family permease
MQHAPNHDAPTRAQWRMVAILCLVNAIAFIDRTALPLLVQPIKRDLGISDTEISLLIGAAFILTYAVGGFFVGMLVDRFSRRSILASAIGFWGTATVFCGTASSYAALFLGRCGVGVGESACGPASMSLIKDAFAPQYRGRAVAIWAMGASLGGGCALLFGGAILHLVGESGSIALPLLGVVKSWQLVLIACGLASLPIALLVFSFPEPARRTQEPVQGAAAQEPVASVLGQWRLFVPLFLANAATIMLLTGFSTWIPALMGRTWKLAAGEIGLVFGLITLLLSTSSQFGAGFLVDLVRKRHGVAAVPLLGGLLCAAVAVPAFMIPNAPSVTAAWCLIAVLSLAATSLFTIGTATVVQLTPSAVVGKVTGVHFAWVGIMGSAVAPTLIAVVAERVFGGTPAALGQALSSAAAVLATIGCLGLLAVSWQLRRAAR